MCERMRKANKARAETGRTLIVVPELHAWISGGKVDPVPAEEPLPSAGIPPEKRLKGQGTEGTGKGQGTVLPPDGGSDTAPTRQPPKPQQPPEGIAPQVWADWLQVRKGKRAGPVTETAWSGLVREAAKAGITAEAAVRACCEFGWQGFNAGWYAQRKPLTAGGAPAALSFAERETARKAARYAEMTGGLIGQAATPPTPGEFIDMEPTDGAARLLG